MKFEIEINDEFLKNCLQSAVSDYVYDRARQIVQLAIDDNLQFSKKLRIELFDEITETVKRRLGV